MDNTTIKDSIIKFYLVILKSLGTNVEHTCKNIIALDPGIRTVLTGFDTEDNGFKFVKYGINVLQKKLLRADMIQSVINQKTNETTFTYNHMKRQITRKVMRRVFCKIKHQVRDVHHK